MSDKIILSCILHLVKDIIKMSNDAMIEASTIELRNIFNESITQHGHNQFAIFEYMNQNNMYQITQAPKSDIKKLLALRFID